MTKRIDDFISDFRKILLTYDIDPAIYQNGNCYEFAALLKSVFKSLLLYYSIANGHFVVKDIRNKYYDVNGDVTSIYKYDKTIVEWNNYYDQLHKQRIIDSVILHK